MTDLPQTPNTIKHLSSYSAICMSRSMTDIFINKKQKKDMKNLHESD